MIPSIRPSRAEQLVASIRSRPPSEQIARLRNARNITNEQIIKRQREEGRAAYEELARRMSSTT